jgi:GT2 family glycosyltransferase
MRTRVAGHTSGPALVSVVIPAFEAARFLPRAIRSALGQTYPCREIIVVNDGSPDTTAAEDAISPFRQQIHYVWQANAGAGAARNAGLRLATGAFAAFLDADDYWAPTYLDEQVRFLQDHPECAAVYTDAWIVGDTPLAGRRFMDLSPSSGDVTVASLLSNGCTVITSALVVRLDVIRAANGFTESLRRGQDFDLWLRLAMRGHCIRYQHTALVYRCSHGGNLSDDPIDEHQRVIDVLEQPCWDALSSEEHRLLQHRIATHKEGLAVERGKRSLAAGDIGSAREYFGQVSVTRRGCKMAFVSLMLRTAPGLLRAGYLWRLPSAAMPAGGTAVVPVSPQGQKPRVVPAQTNADPAAGL